MRRLPGELPRRKFLRAMSRLGWTVERVRGSHHQLVHPDYPGVVTVAVHRTISRVAVRKTLRFAGIDEEAFLRVL